MHSILNKYHFLLFKIDNITPGIKTMDDCPEDILHEIIKVLSPGVNNYLTVSDSWPEMRNKAREFIKLRLVCKRFNTHVLKLITIPTPPGVVLTTGKSRIIHWQFPKHNYCHFCLRVNTELYNFIIAKHASPGSLIALLSYT